MSFSKSLGLILLLLTVCFAALPANAQLTHPGNPFSIADLDRMRDNIFVAPWTFGFQELLQDESSSLTYQMRGPFELVNRGPDINLDDYESDSRAVLYQAILYYITGNEQYAQNAVSILDAWATTHTQWGGNTVFLVAAEPGLEFIQGAEILRYTFPGWTAQNTATAEAYFKDTYLPLFDLSNSLRPANQGATQLLGAISVAVFCDDEELFEQALEAFKNEECTLLRNTLATGQVGDTGRDVGHAFLQLRSTSLIAEIAFKQNHDLYSLFDDRLLATSEFWCQYNLGFEVPFTHYGTCYGYYEVIGDRGRSPTSRFANGLLERTHAAYVVRKGLEAPFTDTFLAGQTPNVETFLYRKDVDTSTADPTTPPLAEPAVPVEPELVGMDIGASPTIGSSFLNSLGDIWTIRGSGDTFGGRSEDSCRFVYTPMTQDSTVIVELLTVTGSNGGAKGGIMFRSSLDADADMLSVYGSPTLVAATFRGDRGDQGNRVIETFDDVPLTQYFKVVRQGNRVNAFVSPDKIHFTPIASRIFEPSGTYYIGLFASSNQNSLSESQLRNVEFFVEQAPVEVVATVSSDSIFPPTVSSTDLGQTAFLSSTAVSFEELSFESDQLFNGLIGNFDGDTSDSGEVPLGNGDTFTINLDTSQQADGYDITQIDSVYGWSPVLNGRSNQGYGIRFDLVDGTSQFVDGQHWAPNSPAFFWTSVSLTAPSGGPIASGVESITFNITEGANAGGGFMVAREFDIFGVPTSDILLGDVNLDGIVDFGDIPTFIARLAAGVFQAEADVDVSGAVTFADIPTFIAILSSQ